MATKKLHSFNLTVSQSDALDALVNEAGISKSEAIRQGMKLLCEKHGIAWPDDMPEWGAGLNQDTKQNEAK